MLEKTKENSEKRKTISFGDRLFFWLGVFCHSKSSPRICVAAVERLKWGCRNAANFDNRFYRKTCLKKKKKKKAERIEKLFQQNTELHRWGSYFLFLIFKSDFKTLPPSHRRNLDLLQNFNSIREVDFYFH